MYADSLSFWRDMKEYKLREYVYQSHSFIYNLKVLKFVFLLDIKKVSEGLASVKTQFQWYRTKNNGLLKSLK